MADSLGYHFPELFLQKGAYTPQWHGDLEQYQMTILKGLAVIMLGIRAFPMNVTGFPVNEESNKALMDFLHGKQPLPVCMESLSDKLNEPLKEDKSQDT